MSNENTNTPPPTCHALHAAYETMRSEPTKEHFIALLETFEAEVKKGALGFIPVESNDVEALKKEGSVKWCIANSEKGPAMALFTSEEQVDKQGEKPHVGIPLGAFIQATLSNKEMLGIIVNPLDGQNGFLIERSNLEVLARRLGAAPKMPPQVVSEACLRLFDVAVGVPCPVYDIQADLAKVGGPDILLKPIMEKWNKAIAEKTFRPASGEEYVKTIVKDAMAIAFVNGAFIRKDPALIKDADPAMCLDAVPYLKEDIVQNTDEFIIILSDLIRASFAKIPDDQLWNLLVANVGVCCFGAACFGFGWGIAKYTEGLGTVALSELRMHEKDFRRKIDKMRKQATERHE